VPEPADASHAGLDSATEADLFGRGLTILYANSSA